jgi:tRNA threonylcarbamoyladenosine biosynthesis protein TsaB
MLILAVDTSTRFGSVALRERGALLGQVRRDLEGGHSSWLLDAAAELLGAAGRGHDALEGLAVATGPGSFTGLRVGLATVQGLALPSGTPCLGVSTLDLLAWKVRGSAPKIAAVMDAWRDEVYAGKYDGRGLATSPPGLRTPEAFGESLADAGWAIFGDGVLRYRSQIEAACPSAVFPKRSLYLAAALAELAEERLAEGAGRPGAELRPVYLRPPALRRAKP